MACSRSGHHPVNAVGMKLNSIRLHGDLINVTGLGGEDLGVWHLM
jgi:hypothetical protein